MVEIHECPVCAHEKARQVPTTHPVILIVCPECGRFPMFGSFKKGWPSLPAPKREEIAQFLCTTREQREALQVELAILDVDTWRIYSQEGQSRIRRAELTRSRKGEEGKDPSL
jgi:hypothetical protein